MRSAEQRQKMTNGRDDDATCEMRLEVQVTSDIILLGFTSLLGLINRVLIHSVIEIR
jgi:hypothetical protein